MIQNLKVKKLGLQDYKKTWASMMNTVLSKSEDDQDEVWLLEHPPVFSLGLGGEDQHILSPGNIPVVKSDWGGRAPYHGPGQLVDSRLGPAGRGVGQVGGLCGVGTSRGWLLLAARGFGLGGSLAPLGFGRYFEEKP